MDDRTLMRMTRAGVVVVMLLGVAASLAFARIYDAWIFMASVMVSVVFVPVMGALYLKPKRACGMSASIAGLAALLVFYVLIYTKGDLDVDEGSYVWRIGSMEIWREYAVLFALPLSGLGYLAGQMLGTRSS